MLSVSPEFETAITAQTRRMTGRVTINFSDALLDPSFIASSPDEAYITQTEQASNGRDEMTRKWFSLDGTSILDGTFFPAPDTSEQANFNEFGWWSSAINVGGTFASPPELTVEFSARQTTSVLCSFDNKRGEYAVNFDVQIYQGAVLADTRVITGNTKTERTISFPAILNVDKIILVVKTWSTTGTVAKVAEFTPGLIQQYDESRLLNYSVLEEKQISNSNSIPVGNISNNELNVELQNIDGLFDTNNFNSSIFGRVRPWVRCTPEIGVFTGTDFEYIPMGTFWAKAWNVPEGSESASLNAQDRLSLLDTTRITTGVIQTNQTIFQLFETVLQDAGLSVTEYNIDTRLNDSIYTIAISWFDDQTHRAALQKLAEASGASVFADRNGLIQVQSIDFLFSENLVSLRDYTQSDYMDKQNPTDYTELANRITVPTTRIKLNASQELFRSPDDETIEANTTDTITILLDDRFKPAENQVATVDPVLAGVTVIAQTWYSWGGNITVENTTGTSQNYRLVVNGDFYEQVGGKEQVAVDTNSVDELGKLNFRYRENEFLQSSDLAQRIANVILATYSDPQANVSVVLDPGGDPSLEVGDRIQITDKYTSIFYNILRQEIDFNGGLGMKIDGIRARLFGDPLTLDGNPEPTDIILDGNIVPVENIIDGDF